jgi:hypothetical protein
METTATETAPLKFLRRCNGFSSPRRPFSQATLDLLVRELAEARKVFKASVSEDLLDRWGDYFLGSRFYRDERAIAAIESAATEAEVLADVKAWCLDAVRECAQADNWYEYHKAWD